MKVLCLVIFAVVVLLSGCESITPPDDEPHILDTLVIIDTVTIEEIEGVAARHVDLSGLNIKDEDLYQLHQIEGLNSLKMENCDSVNSLHPLIGLDLIYLDIDSCDGIEEIPLGQMTTLKHLEAGYCWNVYKNYYVAFNFTDSLDLDYLGVGFVGATGSKHLKGLSSGDTLAGGSIEDRQYYVDSGVVFIDETEAANVWYNEKTQN